MAEPRAPSIDESGASADSVGSWLREAVDVANPGTSDSLSPRLRPGAVVSDRFTIERLAGSGGMGAVYRALDRSTQAPVAIKVLAYAREQHADRLAREAQVLSDLSHPAIVRYVAHGKLEDGAPYLAMEWLEGEDLAQRLARAGLSVEESLAVVRRACEGLVAAHARGIVHRDLKPSNLFLVGGEAPATKVVDFGIARPATSARPLTQTGAVLGTVGYMAPEQAMGVVDVDARADVFALGCVLFECLTGQPAFSGSHDVAVLAKVLRVEPPRVSDLRAGLGDGVDAVVARLLDKDRARRPADAGAVLRELASLGELGGGAPTPHADRKGEITDSEQRIVTVLLGYPPDRDGPGGDSALAPTEPMGGIEVVRARALRFGAEAVPIRGGASSSSSPVRARRPIRRRAPRDAPLRCALRGQACSSPSRRAVRRRLDASRSAPPSTGPPTC